MVEVGPARAGAPTRGERMVSSKCSGREGCGPAGRARGLRARVAALPPGRQAARLRQPVRPARSVRC
ncbi:hypothetical protein STRTUCAR8_01532 [Streptomyces turgidiscabies Car8]|uniref:Uncharacterized protein n=1 Tax=Streptomyces turgidiscabies (strain Car8) TaxID=698760 RepID=L7F3Z7_STRT8|nr:hypothetical protein STRTUCAR8_01532 [Streptomyces turgidiscabies Car8]